MSEFNHVIPFLRPAAACAGLWHTSLCFLRGAFPALTLLQFYFSLSIAELFNSRVAASLDSESILDRTAPKVIFQLAVTAVCLLNIYLLLFSSSFKESGTSDNY